MFLEYFTPIVVSPRLVSALSIMSSWSNDALWIISPAEIIFILFSEIFVLKAFRYKSDIFERIYKNVADADVLLTEIVNQIAHVDDVATNIAALSEEQSASTEEILASTEVLAEASLQFSEDSRQVAKGADEVADASFALAEHMRKFKI